MKSAKKKTRKFRILCRPNETRFGRLLLIVDGVSEEYTFFPMTIPTDGVPLVAMKWSKVGGVRDYVVTVQYDGSTSCNCKGSVGHGHCKHRDATPAILEYLSRSSWELFRRKRLGKVTYSWKEGAEESYGLREYWNGSSWLVDCEPWFTTKLEKAVAILDNFGVYDPNVGWVGNDGYEYTYVPV